MKSAEIRQAFLDFFASKDHAVVHSSSLVPGNDPTLLFTNAGMVQFKDVFLGSDKRNYVRATSCQRCVRAGGKHNDLENVGYTARHHTFFEMLGNFSFGDYFKRDAIKYAWEFLTEVLKLPPERLWVTVHISDDEAADIWIKEVGVDPNRFSRLDEDNFWKMGDTGPCGPCSEIFFDHGDEVPGGPPGSENDDLDRYIEIWNLVFMQYEQQPDGKMIPLPKPSVDTGAGLERLAAVMQHTNSNYEIDLFQNLLGAVIEVSGATDHKNKSLRVIADHIRSCSFLIADGVQPSNEGRGYVLRRIIRRAIRHGHKLGVSEAFFHKLVSALEAEMGSAYPELTKQKNLVEKVLLQEEEQFAQTLDKGMKILEAELIGLSGKEIPGAIVFKLYDTYGFPTDLTNDIAREKGLTLDMQGYQACMAEQVAQSQSAGKFKVDYTESLDIEGETTFEGYQTLVSQSTVTALVKGGERVDMLVEGDQGFVVLDGTPFYAESGGQVGDTGEIGDGSNRFEVQDCVKNQGNHLHVGVMTCGQLKVGDSLPVQVDGSLRQAIVLNHSATHLLHAALRTVLGEHVTQKGSLVDSEKLRFDFSHMQAVTTEELKQIETLVNDQVRLNTEVTTDVCDMDTAKSKGAMMLFGEKYGDSVRVLSMGDGFSVELCGGTHVKRTGDIGLLRIVSESGISAGVRRIEAVTGQKALDLFDSKQETLQAAAQIIKASPALLVEKISALVAENKKLEKSIDQLKAKLASASSGDLAARAQEVNGVKVLATKLENVDGKSLMNTVDQLKNKLGSGVIFIAATEGEKIALVASVTKDVSSKISAGDLMRFVAPQVDGKGGGKPELARGSGNDASKIDGALEGISGWVENQLGD